jgi:hypothetical protein
MRRLRRDIVGRQEKTEDEVAGSGEEEKVPKVEEEEVVDSSDEEKRTEVRREMRVELDAKERFEMPG